jgi:hypothetical protein
MATDDREVEPVRSEDHASLAQPHPDDIGPSRATLLNRRIRKGAFIALLVLWPIVVALGQMWSPSASGLNLPFAASSLIFYAGCALALRSRTIAGTLLGLSIFPFTAPAVSADDWKTRLLGCGILGLVWGIAWEVVHSLKPSKPELPSA